MKTRLQRIGKGNGKMGREGAKVKVMSANDCARKYVVW